MASPEKASPGGQVRPTRGGTSDSESVAPSVSQRARGASRKRHRVPQCTRNPRTARRLLAVALAEVLERGLLEREQVAPEATPAEDVPEA